MNKLTIALAILCLPILLWSQIDQPPFTPATERIQGFEKRKKLQEESLVANFPFKNIGPTVFSGRVADVDVNDDDPTQFYVAYASGGLWKTENNGQSFTPIFDQEMTMTIGDIVVDWPKNIVWIGTGESNSSRSSYAGVGMYRSLDGGKTWQHRGLGESHHIGRVLMHPTDPNTVWVAALGHLYSPNSERGVYKTTDGGETWRKVLFVNENTGAIDLVLDPHNANVLYAAMWEKERRAWNLEEAGKGSGIFKSTDGGENWANISGAGSGFATGEKTGRIGLAAAKSNGNTILYAIVDNQNRRPKDKEEPQEGLTKDKLRNMGKEEFLKIKTSVLAAFLKDNNFPEKYTAEEVLKMVKEDKYKPIALVEYLEDANSLLFDTPVIGAEVYRSVDGGKTWQKTHEGFLEDTYYSYGYYFGQIRVAPQNPEHVYIYGVPILVSMDGGKHWKSINEENVHVDHHALWVNPKKEGHLILGNDGGINISYDDGKNWVKCNSPAVGQFYYVAVDMAETYNVYGGLQDNGVWYGEHTYKASNRWHNSGQYPYKSLLGGDGMQVAIDTRDNNIVYTGFQFGNYYRINKETDDSEGITPSHELGERPLRWNWQTPIHLSVHNQDIIYMGSNKLHRSFNQGQDFKAISEDLTKGGIKGDVPYGTLSAIHESPLKFGLLYCGSDDGRVHVTKDGGDNWTEITAGLPPNMWVSRIQASQHEQSRVYIALNGYRWDNFQAMVYVSEDYGTTWTAIGTDLPLEPVNVIKEDPKDPNLLYVGTDNGLYISLNKGIDFMKMGKDMPDVPVHDVVVHPRDNDLIVGTHGRSIYLADVQYLQEYQNIPTDAALYVFDIQKTRYRSNWGNKGYTWSEDEPEPEIILPLFTKSSGDVKISILADDIVLNSWTVKVTKGYNFPEYNATLNKNVANDYEKWLNKKKKADDKNIEVKAAKNDRYYLQKGTYKIVFEKDGVKVEKELVIEGGGTRGRGGAPIMEERE